MPRVALSDTGEWQLKNSEQDIRGYAVVDDAGARIGTVDEMIVNTDDRRVDAIVLEDGREVPARDIHIGEDAVFLSATAATAVGDRVAVYDDGEVVERREVASRDPDAYTEDFRSHYTETYGGSGQNYSYYEPAYRFGYDAAFEEDYRNRSYRDAEDDLRRSYSAQFPSSDYGDVEDAVRHGYNRARRGRR